MEIADKLSLAQSIASSVYEMQVESEFFLEHLEDDLDINEKFSETLLADEGHKTVMLQLMCAEVLGDMIRDSKFIENHTDKDGNVVYDPEDRVYDSVMANFIERLYHCDDFRPTIMATIKEALPKTEYEVTATFSFTGKVKIKANSIDEAIELAGSRGNKFPDVSDVEDTCSGWVVTDAIEIV